MTKVAKTYRIALFFGAAAGVLMAASASVAADAPATTSDQTATRVPEVTITAERRTENLQKVPISATVLGTTDLKEKGVIGIQDLQNQTPGLSIQPAVSAETFVNIRGVGIQQTNPASSEGVSFYVDGQYIPSLIDTVDTFYDLSNVEVLRGPQGTQIGTNSTGGAIFVNSVQPSFDHVKGYFQQTLGDYNERRSEFGINLPLNDMVAARAALVYETRDSFTKNIGVQTGAGSDGNSNQPGNVNFVSARLQVAVKPVSNLLVTFRFEPYSSKNDGYAVKPDMNYPGFGANPVPTSGSPYFDPAALAIQNQPYKINYDTPQYFDIVGQRSSANLAWNINDSIELKTVTSYQTGYESDQTDIDAATAPINEYLVRKASFNTFTQEVNLLSTSASPFQWVVGAYYLQTKGPLHLDFVNGPGGAIDVISDHTNTAGFASGTYQLTSQWSVTVGARYSHDDQPFHEIGCPVICGNYSTGDSEWTGTAKLNWQVDADTLVYASVANGYKAGGINLHVPIIGINPPPFEPEKNVVEELGLKTALFDRHLRFDGDIFNSQYSQYQLQETIQSGPFTAPYTQSAGRADSYGGEAEFTGVFDDLRFNLGVAYLHSTVGSQFSYTVPNGSKVGVPAGTVLPFAPEWTLTAGVQYDFHIGDGKLTPRLQYQYQDAQYINILSRVPTYTADNTIPSHGTADFRLTYASPQNWTLEGYVTNFTNKIYIADVNGLLGGGGESPVIAYGAPRQWGARLSYKF